jgi:hypothetical protein
MKPENPYDWHKIDQLPRWVKKGFGWFCPADLEKLCPKHGLYYNQHPNYLKGSWFEYKSITTIIKRNQYDSILKRWKVLKVKESNVLKP